MPESRAEQLHCCGLNVGITMQLWGADSHLAGAEIGQVLWYLRQQWIDAGSRGYHQGLVVFEASAGY